MIIKKFDDAINEYASPRLPVNIDYWNKRGKDGKKVALYTHDDLDGIFCAIEMKKWLLNKGFEIVKYGLVSYTEGWKYTTLDPTLINIALDFASLPKGEDYKLIDYYLDHHGNFTEFEIDKYKSLPIQKKKTACAYEAICQNLNIPQDELTLSVIDMVDSAKYIEYGITWDRLLDFNLEDIKKSDKTRLEFASAFNQFLKRSDHKTIISVIHNCKDASIYSIYNVMKRLYPEHNKQKEFINDSQWRLNQMSKRTRGKYTKKIYNTASEFLNDFISGGLVKMDGYQFIGDLIFVPSGTWANALRARSIVETDFKNGDLEKEPKFILLQYGSTLQVCSYAKMDETTDLPTLKNGDKVTDLGEYMINTLSNFQKYLGYNDPDTSIGQDEITVSGGHGGIGSISNIFGVCDVEPYVGFKYIDMFKNKIISDLSGVVFKLNTKWSDVSDFKSAKPEMDNKVLKMSDVTKLNNKGEIIHENYEYNLVDNKTGDIIKVSRDEFIKAGSKRGMKPLNNIKIDNDKRIVVAKFESYNK